MSYLVVLTNAVDGRDDEFNDWYTDRHLHDVVALDGVVAGRRYRFVTEGPSGVTSPPYRYCAIYEVEDGREEDVNAQFLAKGRERDEAWSTGAEPSMVLSPALARLRSTFFVEAITPWVRSTVPEAPSVEPY